MFSFALARRILLVAGLAVTGGCKRPAEKPPGDSAAKVELRRAVEPQVPPALASGLQLRDRVESLRDQFSAPDRESTAELYRMATSSAPATMSKEEWLVMVNEMFEIVRKDPDFDRQAFVDQLLAIYGDASMDGTIRDYAAQHVCLAAQQEQDPAAKAEMVKAVLSALVGAATKGTPGDEEGTALGTSLLAVAELLPTAEKMGIEDRELRDSTENLLGEIISGSRTTSTPNRVTAIQAASKLELSSAVGPIRRLAEDPDGDLGIRLSAVSALGKFSEERDQRLLEDLAKSNTPVRHAAIEALKNYEINSRH